MSNNFDTKNKTNSSKLISSNMFDPDEQFVLDVIKKTKQESIENLIDLLRLQESKSVALIRLLERYKVQLEEK
jgi:hypothetical protein